MNQKKLEEKRDEDYVTPKSLPPPIKVGKPNPFLGLLGALALALILAAILAFASSKLYIILLFEAGIGFAFSFAFVQLAKLSRYIKINNLAIIAVISIVILYFFNQFFQFLITTNGNNLEISFLEFIRSKLEGGFTIQRGGNNINLGPIGLVISWVFQVGFTYLIFHLRAIPALLAFQVERVPNEVLEFTLNYFNEEKSEDFIRAELALRGWSERENQERAFDAVYAFVSIHQMRRE